MPHHMSTNATHAGPHTEGSVIHWARAYDFFTSLVGAGPNSGARQKTVLRAEFKPGEKVLDVGCGPGVLTLLAAERVGATGETHGIDPSPEMIKLAQQKAAKAAVPATFRQAVMEDLPFPDGTFDVVLSSMMLHHLPDDLKSKGFAEVKRVLKPGGRFLAFDLSGKGLMGRLMSLVGHRFPPRYDRHLAEMMTTAGFAAQVLQPDEQRYVVILAHKPA